MAVDVGNDYDFSDDDFDPSTISKVNVHKIFARFNEQKVVFLTECHLLKNCGV